MENKTYTLNHNAFLIDGERYLTVHRPPMDNEYYIDANSGYVHQHHKEFDVVGVSRNVITHSTNHSLTGVQLIEVVKEHEWEAEKAWVKETCKPIYGDFINGYTTRALSHPHDGKDMDEFLEWITTMNVERIGKEAGWEVHALGENGMCPVMTTTELREYWLTTRGNTITITSESRNGRLIAVIK